MDNVSRTVPKMMRNSDFVKYLIEDYNNRAQKEKDNAKTLRESVANESITLYENSIKDPLEARSRRYTAYNNFIDDVHTALLTEAFYSLCYNSIPNKYRKEAGTDSFVRAIVCDFIRENGVYNILNKMKYRSPYLSNVYNAIQEAVEETKKANVFDPSYDQSFEVPQETIGNYLDKTGDEKMDLINTISKKVVDAIKDFVEQNLKDQEKIKDISQAAVDKIDAEREKVDNADLEEDEMKELEESYHLLAKDQISKVRSRPRSVLESMVINIGESVLKSDDLKKMYTTESNMIDMSKVMSKTVMFYTFLETVNTTNLYTVDTDFINSFLNSLIA